MLAQVIEVIAKERQLERPSVSYGAVNLYMHGPLEEMTRDNLSKVRHAFIRLGCEVHHAQHEYS